MNLVIIVVLLFSAPTFAKLKIQKDNSLQSNCGEVVLVKVSSDHLEVVYHPEDAPPIDQGGNNRGEIFKKQEFDLQLVALSAYEVMKNRNLVFCGGLESPDKTKMEPGFTIGPKSPVVGIKITKIAAGSVYQKLGLKNDDTVKEINGELIDSIDILSSLLSKAKNGDKINLLIERGGKEKKLHYLFR